MMKKSIPDPLKSKRKPGEKNSLKGGVGKNMTPEENICPCNNVDIKLGCFFSTHEQQPVLIEMFLEKTNST